MTTTFSTTHTALLRISFDTAVDQLTQPLTVRVDRDGGQVEAGRVPCLLDQLADAVQLGGEATGGRGFGSRPPAALNALEAIAEITAHLRPALARLGIPETGGRLAGHVLSWAAFAGQWQHEAPGYLAYAAGLAERWVALARSVVEPSPAMAIRMPCPACGVAVVLVHTDSDPDPVRRPALSVHTGRDAVTCLACESCWGYDMWGQLAALLDQQRRETLCVATESDDTVSIPDDQHP